MMQPALAAYTKFLKDRKVALPAVHIVLGSGFGTALDSMPWENAGDLSFADVPGLHASTVPDHAGRYRFFRHASGLVACFQMGRLHGYEGYDPQVVTRTVMIPRLLGIKNFLLTNAAGGLAPEYKPGDVMLIRDHVNLTGKNPLIGANPTSQDGKELGPRFPDLCDLYDRAWRDRLLRHCRKQNLGVHEGTYLGLLGPSFETPAEVSLFASWGLQAVGMSTVWEAIALRHSGARVAGLSLISNLGAGMGGVQLDHLKIVETCRASAAGIVQGIRTALEEEFSGV